MKPVAVALAVIAAAAISVVLVAPDDDVAVAIPHGSTDAPQSHEATGRDGRADVTRSTFAGDWPLVVNAATLQCEPRLTGGRTTEVATVVISDRTYALNGTAHHAGYPALGALWLDNESNPGAKVSISDFVTAARAICQSK